MRKRNKKKENRKKGLIGVVLLFLIGIVTLVGFVNSQQGELDELIGELNEEGYGWLVDYNVTYPFIEVYRQNDSNLLATFDNIINGKYQIFLTNLSENESQDVFDLLIKDGELEFDWIVDPAGQTNNWKCTGTTIRDFTNTSCWTLGSIPVGEETVIFN